MIAPLWRGASASRWFARDEVHRRFVWVHRFERDVDCSAIVAQVSVRPTTKSCAGIHTVERFHCAGASLPCPAIVSEFVPSISIDDAVQGRLFRDATHALGALRNVVDALDRGVARSALGVDARGLVVVAHPAAATFAIAQAPEQSVAEFAAVARAITDGLARSPAITAALDSASSFDSIAALDRALESAGATTVDIPASIPASLSDGPLAAAKLARAALDDEAFCSSATAEAIAPQLLRSLAQSPLDANKLALLSLLEPTCKSLRERSMRDRTIDKIILALLGPLEPTWIPLHPAAAARTALIDGAPRTLCPMLWNELQPTAALDGRDARYCLACARAVHATLVDGEPHVIASPVCAFVKRPR